MSTGAEQEMRKRLSAVLDGITPGPAPVAAVIRRGRTVRRRRITGATAAALAVVAAVVGFGPLGLRLPSAAPENPRPPVVTVVPPGPGAPAGQIASGTVGRQHWSARVMAPQDGQRCVMAGAAGEICPVTDRPVAPVSLTSVTARNYTILVGPVQPRVTRVEVLFADGQRLTLHPATPYGDHRWVAFAVPTGVRVSRAVAYDGQAVYRYAVPFGGPPGRPLAPNFVTWLRPGEAGLPRRAITVASVLAAGHRWPVIEYTGPWGRCLEFPGGGYCAVGAGSLMEPGRITQGLASVPGGVHLAGATAGAARVTLNLSSGQQIRLTTRAGYGGERFYAFVLPRGTKVVSWTAYGTDGNRLGSGTGAGIF
jgi:hypothetical protein